MPATLPGHHAGRQSLFNRGSGVPGRIGVGLACWADGKSAARTATRPAAIPAGARRAGPRPPAQRRRTSPPVPAGRRRTRTSRHPGRGSTPQRHPHAAALRRRPSPRPRRHIAGTGLERSGCRPDHRFLRAAAGRSEPAPVAIPGKHQSAQPVRRRRPGDALRAAAGSLHRRTRLDLLPRMQLLAVVGIQDLGTQPHRDDVPPVVQGSTDSAAAISMRTQSQGRR